MKSQRRDTADLATPEQTRHRSPVRSRRRVGVLLGLSYVGFVNLGLPDGLLGVAIVLIAVHEWLARLASVASREVAVTAS
jgi:hypothetical protein